MKLLHTVKSGKVNEIPLSSVRYATRHKKTVKGVEHEGWAIIGKYEDKEHEYLLLYTPKEAREFKTWLEKMLTRFEDDDLTFIQEETHDE